MFSNKNEKVFGGNVKATIMVKDKSKQRKVYTIFIGIRLCVIPIYRKVRWMRENDDEKPLAEIIYPISAHKTLWWLFDF